MLKKDPQQLLLRIIESPSKDAHILFDFLADHPDYTQLGYFSALMACYGNSFQDKVSHSASIASPDVHEQQAAATPLLLVLQLSAGLHGVVQCRDLQ